MTNVDSKMPYKYVFVLQISFDTKTYGFLKLYTTKIGA